MFVNYLNKYLFMILVIMFINVRIIRPANILCLLGVPSPSHHIWNKVLIEALVSRGYNMTVLTVENEISTTENLHYIYMEKIYEAIGGSWNKVDDTAKLGQQSATSIITEMYDYFTLVSYHLMKTNGVNILLNYPNDFKFDAIIHDFTAGQSLLGFVDKFNYPPLISVSPFNIPSFTWCVSGAQTFPSYMPHFASSFGTNMVFSQKLRNMFYYIYDWGYRRLFFIKNEQKLAMRVFGGNLPSLHTIEQKTSIVLVNSDWSLDYPQPLPPNVIPIAGIQIAQMPEPLNPFIKEFIDSSKKGTIVFSLGTNMKSDIIGIQRFNMFLQAFEKFPDYNIIWKIESKIKNLPANIITVPWITQNAILSHPKVKLFITHGGLLSVQEAVWHSVPMLGIPLFVDQFQNIRKAVVAGIAEAINIEELTTEILVEKMELLLNTIKYKRNAIQRSKLFKNQPESPINRALFWIEHIIENDGPSYLRPKTIEMSFIEIYLLDIFGVIFGILFIYAIIIKRHFKSLKIFGKEYLTEKKPPPTTIEAEKKNK